MVEHDWMMRLHVTQSGHFALLRHSLAALPQILFISLFSRLP